MAAQALVAVAKALAPPFTEYGKNLAPARGNQVLPGKTGPIPAEAWKNTPEIVGNLRQDTGSASDLSGDDRCGPTNLLAGALLQGQAKAAAFLDKQATSPNLNPEQKSQLKEIAKAIGHGTASYDQLNKAGDLLYRAANTRTTLGEVVGEYFDRSKLEHGEAQALNQLAAKSPNLNPAEMKQAADLLKKATDGKLELTSGPDPRGNGKQVPFVKVNSGSTDSSGLDDGELMAHAKAGGLKVSSHPIDVAGVGDGEDVSATMLAKLKPGESMVLRIGLTNGEQPNHFVTIGKLPDGRPYIYNPSPGSGDSTLMVRNQKPSDVDNFDSALDELDKRIGKDPGGAIPRTLTVKY